MYIVCLNDAKRRRGEKDGLTDLNAFHCHHTRRNVGENEFLTITQDRKVLQHPIQEPLNGEAK